MAQKRAARVTTEDVIRAFLRTHVPVGAQVFAVAGEDPDAAPDPYAAQWSRNHDPHSVGPAGLRPGARSNRASSGAARHTRATSLGRGLASLRHLLYRLMHGGHDNR